MRVKTRGISRTGIKRLQITEFCRRFHVTYLALFGSVLRDDFGPDSDIDVLVQFETGKEPGLLGLQRMEDELSALLRRRVDLRTPKDLSHYFREKVINEAEAVFP